MSETARRFVPADHPVAVAMRRNLEELPRLVRLAAEYGVRAVSVQHLAEGPARVARGFDEARAAAPDLGVDLSLPNLRPKEGRRGCDWPWRGAYIAYRNSEAYNAFRSRLVSADPPDICKGCAVYNGHF
jgi:MoaA/NifB/PqqE/SkfB family radical SAM enzyme